VSSFSDLYRRALRHRGGPDPLMSDPVIQGWSAPAAGQDRPPRVDALVGIGLGQAGGPAGLTVIPRTGPKPASYDCVHLKRWPGDTAYTDMAEYLARKAGNAPLFNCRTALDAGLGPAIVDTFRRNRGTARLFPVLATNDGKDVVVQPDGTLHVPGAFLASAVLAVLQQGRLKVAGGLLERQQLHAGLKAFGNRASLLTKLNAIVWATGEDDPLVQAVALALWLGEFYTQTKLF
jgi:hypothetical protein